LNRVREFFLLFALSSLCAAGSVLKPDESVLIFPSIGWQTTNGWELEVHGLVFEPHAHTVITRLLRRSLGIQGEELSAAEETLFSERAKYFLVDNERRKRITLKVGARSETLSPTGPNGHFRAEINFAGSGATPGAFAAFLTNGVLEIETLSSNKKVHPFHGQVHLVPQTGLSVISDIDDTIKISEVRDRKALIRNTFCRAYQPVPGMAQLYHDWAGQGALFHYVSASPWQLYVPLSDFISSNGFPSGTFHLKQFRVKDQSVFDLFASPEKYKTSVIGPLLRKFPERQFIFSGDSGEEDPEIYGELARKYPKQVRRIFIRDVTGDLAAGARYQKAFAGISTNAWQIYKRSSEIVTALQ
jgi:hypothetical protein